MFWKLISPLFKTSFQDLIWQRSKDAALVLDVSRTWPTSRTSYWTEAEKAYLERAWTREIRQLRAMVPAAENLDAYIVDHDHADLNSLSLYGEGQIACTRALRTPQLAVLRLYKCHLTWNDLPKLRSLSVVVTHGPNLTELIQVLRSSPLLEQLYLDRISITSEDPSNRASIPLIPINLPRLSIIIIREVSFSLASGLFARLLPPPTCRISKIELVSEQGPGLPGFCHQVGRVSVPQGLAEQITDPRLHILPHALYLQVSPNRCLNINVVGWSNQEERSTIPRRSELARNFFEATTAVSSKPRITSFHLQADSRSNLAEGLAIVHDFFPEIEELDIGIEKGLEALEVLGESTTEEGSTVWLLPKLSVLKARMVASSVKYDGIVTMAVKRNEAATLSPQVLSPLTLLGLAYGRVQSESLSRLDEAGIKYELKGVAVL
ncbi:hypothetical protein FS837_012494 [Tulasnella sp. UAMH 9824]|nr:hypothetical protein FS837_012494 [Tulasnella sp. UAMH 9824]